jgi:hypothetical protein
VITVTSVPTTFPSPNVLEECITIVDGGGVEMNVVRDGVSLSVGLAEEVVVDEVDEEVVVEEVVVELDVVVVVELVVVVVVLVLEQEVEKRVAVASVIVLGTVRVTGMVKVVEEPWKINQSSQSEP